MAASTKITKELHNTYSDIFRHWMLQRHIFIRSTKTQNHKRNHLGNVVYVLQEPFKTVSECLQEQQIIISLRVDEQLNGSTAF